MSEKVSKTEVHDMGPGTSEVFAGQSESRAIQEAYGETAQFFAERIRDRLPIRREPYSLVDIGTFKGELLEQLVAALPEQKLTTIGVDVNEVAMAENRAAQNKVVGSAEALPLEGESVDIAIARYVLQWNGVEKQKQILAEMGRIIKEFGLIEHSGPDIENADEWRAKTDMLFAGEQVPKMKRGEHYYSSRIEIEEWLTALGMGFERVRERTIEGIADIFAARFQLNDSETEVVRNILGESNHFVQTDWVVFPRESERSYYSAAFTDYANVAASFGPHFTRTCHSDVTLFRKWFGEQAPSSLYPLEYAEKQRGVKDVRKGFEKYFGEQITVLNGLVDRMKTAEDELEIKRLVNKMLEVISPNRGPNDFYDEPQFSADLLD